MHSYAVLLVLTSAVLHAAWNAQLKGFDDRSQFMASMSLSMGCVALICVLFLPLPTPAAWICIGCSTILHTAYNLLLLHTYRRSDFSSAYPIARGVSPLLVSLGAFVLMRQQLGALAIIGIALISAGIVVLATENRNTGTHATLSAVATGVTIAAYTVTDGMGVQRSHNVLSYTAWVFSSYLLMPIVLLSLRHRVRLVTRSSLRRAVIAALFSLAAYTLVLWATRYVDVGVVSALRETSVLWAIILGRIYLGESFTWRRAAAAFIICSGIALLVLKIGKSIPLKATSPVKPQQAAVVLDEKVAAL